MNASSEEGDSSEDVGTSAKGKIEELGDDRVEYFTTVRREKGAFHDLEEVGERRSLDRGTDVILSQNILCVSFHGYSHFTRLGEIKVHAKVGLDGRLVGLQAREGRLEGLDEIIDDLLIHASDEEVVDVEADGALDIAEHLIEDTGLERVDQEAKVGDESADVVVPQPSALLASVDRLLEKDDQRAIDIKELLIGGVQGDKKTSQVRVHTHVHRSNHVSIEIGAGDISGYHEPGFLRRDSVDEEDGFKGGSRRGNIAGDGLLQVTTSDKTTLRLVKRSIGLVLLLEEHEAGNDLVEEGDGDGSAVNGDPDTHRQHLP
jgi:hypothetical protein